MVIVNGVCKYNVGIEVVRLKMYWKSKQTTQMKKKK